MTDRLSPSKSPTNTKQNFLEIIKHKKDEPPVMLLRKRIRVILESPLQSTNDARKNELPSRSTVGGASETAVTSRETDRGENSRLSYRSHISPLPSPAASSSHDGSFMYAETSSSNSSTPLSFSSTEHKEFTEPRGGSSSVILRHSSETGTTSSIQLSTTSDQQKKLQKEAKNGRLPKCSQCQNHGVIVKVKGHKRYCPWRHCRCPRPRCLFTQDRRRAMAVQVAMRRAQALDEAREREFQEKASHSSSSVSNTPNAPTILRENLPSSVKCTSSPTTPVAISSPIIQHQLHKPTSTELQSQEKHSNSAPIPLIVATTSHSYVPTNDMPPNLDATVPPNYGQYAIAQPLSPNTSRQISNRTVLLPGGPTIPAAMIQPMRIPPTEIISAGYSSKFMNFRSSALPGNSNAPVMAMQFGTINLGLRRTEEISAADEESIRILLEVFRLPPEADFLVYRILKDCGGDFKLASSKIFEAQCEFRAIEWQMAKERERIEAANGIRAGVPYYPSHSNSSSSHGAREMYNYRHHSNAAVASGETSRQAVSRPARTSLHSSMSIRPHPSPNRGDIENSRGKSPTENATRTHYDNHLL